jgi:cyclin A
MEEKQKDVNQNMRSVLVDWLVDVSEEYHLVPETLYISVNFVDRFLSKINVIRSKLQLVGVTCMLLAAKYEEIHAPPVEEFIFITDSTYKHEEIIQMETVILAVLEFSLTVVTARTFINRFLRAANADIKITHLAHYLAELTLQDYTFLKYKPSIIAASAVTISLQTFGRAAWGDSLQYYSGYSYADILNCTRDLFNMFRNIENTNLMAIREKYAKQEFSKISHSIRAPESIFGL